MLRKFEIWLDVNENTYTKELCEHIKTALTFGPHTVQKVVDVKVVMSRPRIRNANVINNQYRDNVKWSHVEHLCKS